MYDRITEGIQAFCANHSIDEVFNTKFLELGFYVQVEKPLFGSNNMFAYWKTRIKLFLEAVLCKQLFNIFNSDHDL